MANALNQSIRRVLGGAVLAGVLAGSLIYIRSASAQGGLPIEPIAGGFSPDRLVHLLTKGPSDVLTAKLVLPPSGEIPWHSHPGVAIVIIKSGSLTQYHANGCISHHSAGSAFCEQPGEVHRVVNPSTSTPVEIYGTFILPTGSQPLVFEPAPPTRICGADAKPH